MPQWNAVATRAGALAWGRKVSKSPPSECCTDSERGTSEVVIARGDFENSRIVDRR